MADRDGAEDVAHEVVLKVMQGRLSGANPERGRFRDYLKTVVIHSARSSGRREARSPVVAPDPELPVESEAVSFEACIREDLMKAAWRDLEECEQRTKQPFASLLQRRTTVERTSSSGLCEFLNRHTGREFSSANARNILQRAREHYAHLLLERVRQLLPVDQRDADSLEEELIVPGLHEACRGALWRE